MITTYHKITYFGFNFVRKSTYNFKENSNTSYIVARSTKSCCREPQIKALERCQVVSPYFAAPFAAVRWRSRAQGGARTQKKFNLAVIHGEIL